MSVALRRGGRNERGMNPPAGKAQETPGVNIDIGGGTYRGGGIDSGEVLREQLKEKVGTGVVELGVETQQGVTMRT